MVGDVTSLADGFTVVASVVVVAASGVTWSGGGVVVDSGNPASRRMRE